MSKTVESIATISERGGIWKVLVRRDRKLAAKFETGNLFELIDWLKNHHPRAKVPQQNFARLLH